MFGPLMVVSCIKKTIEYFFTINKVIKWHWNIMVKNCVKMGNIFCCFMLIIAVLSYIFKMFCICVGMALFIGNAPLKIHLRQLFVLIHFFSYSFVNQFTSTWICFFFLTLKVVSATVLLVCFVSLKESTCETRKNIFYFTSKALFILEIIKF